MTVLQREIQHVLAGQSSEDGPDERLSPSSGAAVSLLLGEGGDRRIWPDPVTRRNRYGTRITPADDEISFASTTATNLSMAGFLAVSQEFQRLVGDERGSSINIGQWFSDIRGRIARGLGVADAQVVLAASGTDAELIVLGMFAGLSGRPITNILVAPDETGSGVPRAAAGLHYSDITALGHPVEAGAPLGGLPSGHIEVRSIAIRNEAGEPRHAEAIDADLIAIAEQELKRDRDVLIHVLDISKTGLTGVTRQAARQLARQYRGRAHVLVDACQLRCPISQLRQDLDDGFVVAVTGSKFIGGPPFSGAVLVPAALAADFAGQAQVPEGLAQYTALHDWPVAFRGRVATVLGSNLNLGLGLRWIAALENLKGYAEVAESAQSCIREQFVRLVRSRIEDSEHISLHPDDEGDCLASSAIVPFTITQGDGSFASFEESQKIQLLMRSPGAGPVCHIGQAVRLGSRSVLRIAASATDITAVSEGMAAGLSLQQALRPIETRLDVVFERLSALLHQPKGV